METKDIYKALLDTRNYEITMFWTRSNYFLLLNSAIAVGLFGTREYYAKFAVVFAIFGLLASLLWFWVCLGGKYWQVRWEQQLAEYERANCPELKAFSATPQEVQATVERGMHFDHRMSWVQRKIYALAAKQKPSVSYSMIRLSMLFSLGWFLWLATFFLTGKAPLAA
jgi:hypothetical protein